MDYLAVFQATQSPHRLRVRIVFQVEGVMIVVFFATACRILLNELEMGHLCLLISCSL